jgi:hypothetical protein
MNKKYTILFAIYSSLSTNIFSMQQQQQISSEELQQQQINKDLQRSLYFFKNNYPEDKFTIDIVNEKNNIEEKNSLNLYPTEQQENFRHFVEKISIIFAGKSLNKKQPQDTSNLDKEAQRFKNMLLNKEDFCPKYQKNYEFCDEGLTRYNYQEEKTGVTHNKHIDNKYISCFYKTIFYKILPKYYIECNNLDVNRYEGMNSYYFENEEYEKNSKNCIFLEYTLPNNKKIQITLEEAIKFSKFWVIPKNNYDDKNIKNVFNQIPPSGFIEESSKNIPTILVNMDAMKKKEKHKLQIDLLLYEAYFKKQNIENNIKFLSNIFNIMNNNNNNNFISIGLNQQQQQQQNNRNYSIKTTLPVSENNNNNNNSNNNNTIAKK